MSVKQLMQQRVHHRTLTLLRTGFLPQERLGSDAAAASVLLCLAR